MELQGHLILPGAGSWYWGDSFLSIQGPALSLPGAFPPHPPRLRVGSTLLCGLEGAWIQVIGLSGLSVRSLALTRELTLLGEGSPLF